MITSFTVSFLIKHMSLLQYKMDYFSLTIFLELIDVNVKMYIDLRRTTTAVCTCVGKRDLSIERCIWSILFSANDNIQWISFCLPCSISSSWFMWLHKYLENIQRQVLAIHLGVSRVALSFGTNMFWLLTSNLSLLVAQLQQSQNIYW